MEIEDFLCKKGKISRNIHIEFMISEYNNTNYREGYTHPT